jgi:hypothetical protein
MVLKVHKRAEKLGAESMIRGRASIILPFAFVCAGCLDARSRAIKTVERVNSQRLRTDVAKNYKDIFAEHRKTVVTLNPTYYPWAFRQLEPKRVTAYPDGFAFCLERSGAAESGLYVVPFGMDHEPKPTSWASFEKVSDGIYWYTFTP